MKIYKSMEELIGATPLVELRNIEHEKLFLAEGGRALGAGLPSVDRHRLSLVRGGRL